MTKYEKLVSDAAKAYEFYSEDELEQYATKLRISRGEECEACGSPNMKTIREVLIDGDVKKTYICQDCGHSTWVIA